MSFVRKKFKNLGVTKSGPRAMISLMESRKKHWEHFLHGADIGVRGFGPSKEEAFEQAAAALMNVITNVPIEAKDEIEVSCEAPDDEMLFVDWLNALFQVTLKNRKLYGQAWGEKVDVKKHQLQKSG